MFVSEGREAAEGCVALYIQGMSGTRAQGSMMALHLSKPQGPPPKEGGGEGKWMERLVEETNGLVSEAMGSVKEVQTALLLGASSGWALEEVPALVAPKRHGREGGGEGGEAAQPMKLLEAMCVGCNTARVAPFYDEERPPHPPQSQPPPTSPFSHSLLLSSSPPLPTPPPTFGCLVDPKIASLTTSHQVSPSLTTVHELSPPLKTPPLPLTTAPHIHPPQSL